MSKIVAKAIRFAVAAGLLTALFVAAPTPRALAATIVVTTTNPNVNLGDGQCSLIEAINEANTTGGSGGDCSAGNAGADTIELGAGATYTLTGVENVFDSQGNGLPRISSDITIKGNGSVIERDITAPAFRLFHVASASKLSLNSITLRNGDSNACCTSDTAGGGGIFNEGVITLDNVVVTKNSGTYGGAIRNYIGSTMTIKGSAIVNNNANLGGGVYSILSDSLTIVDSEISNNTSFGEGGGVYYASNSYFPGSLIVINSLLSNNSVSDNMLYKGGGILSDFNVVTIVNSMFVENLGDGVANIFGTVAVTKSVFIGNSGYGLISMGYSDGSMSINDSIFSRNQGGVYNRLSGGMLTIDRSVFANNSGRGLENSPSGTSGSSSSVVVNNSVFMNNSGGAVYNADNGTIVTMFVNNSTFSGNSAAWGAGGIYNEGSNTGSLAAITITNSTFYNNISLPGQGDAIANWGDYAQITLRNTLIANNFSGMNCLGVTTDGGNNLQFPDASCGPTIPVADPLLDPLADNGGPTQTHALLPGSPAIDAGNNAICAAAPINNLDQRGVKRPQGLVCDIGAFEFQLASPDPNFPANGNTPPTARPLFDWNNVGEATSYTLQISTNQNFTTLALNTIITPSAYVMPTDLPRNTLLFWRVRANRPGEAGPWSRVRHFFSANPPGVPSLLTPANGATVANGQPTLDWNDVAPAATYYEVQIATDQNFTTLLGRGRGGKTNLSQYTPEAALSPGATYFWRVRAVSGGADGGMQFSQWSAARRFQTP